jgi:hypothetical protein
MRGGAGSCGGGDIGGRNDEIMGDLPSKMD